MVYFDMMGPLKVLPDEEKGQLFWAMLEYGKDGVSPKFDGLLALAWEFVKPKLDKDFEEYGRTVLKRQYATFCRIRKKNGDPEMSFEDWLATLDDQNYQMISSDIKCYPTTTTATSTTTTTATTTAAAVTTTTTEELAAAAADRKLKMMQGDLGKGVVALTDVQIDLLLEKLGLEMFDFYVDKLSTFIIKNGAKVKSHYDTILRWYREDCSTDS